MVARFQKMTFDEQMQKLVDCMLTRNPRGIYESSHTLKGASSYIGAFKFSKACKELQFAGNYLHLKEDKKEGNVKFDRKY